MDAADLDIVLISNLLELFHAGSKLGQGNVDRSTESSSKVGWARGDVAEVVIMSKLSNSFNV